MASNFFGQIFRITTFGESHGPGIGVVIDGCPAGLPITVEEINAELAKRRPGQSSYTSPRKEPDTAEILSGIFEGQTTGAPIAILIRNHDVDSTPYLALKDVIRPGHANATYLAKYGIFDYRGAGRASARETAGRVAAGAIAKKLLTQYNITCTATIDEIGGVCGEEAILEKIASAQHAGDSVGGIIACTAHIPAGLGDPVYGKLEALLASAMLSIPASKGFEIGHGFQAARMYGSEHNPTTGGTLGGISDGTPLFFRVAFKPTSSIKKPQTTSTFQGEKITIQTEGRHDPCVALRAVPIVEAMTALVLIDCVLMTQSAAIKSRRGSYTQG